MLLEQRLHYREYKIRELINSSNRKLVPGVELNSNGNSNGNNNLNSNSNTNLEDDDNESESESELTCSSIGSNGGKKGATNSGSADCHVVPILIPITFVPPSG